MSNSDNVQERSGQRDYRDTLEYLTCLADAAKRSWAELYEAYDELTFPKRLVLVHPRWYEPNTKVKNCKVRGKRDRKVNKHFREVCESIKFWNYECPFDDPDIKIDHVFPWSLGGPSEPSNSAYLCEYHNLLKGPDIHHLELSEDNFNFGWFPETLEKVRKKLA